MLFKKKAQDTKKSPGYQKKPVSGTSCNKQPERISHGDGAEGSGFPDRT